VFKELILAALLASLLVFFIQLIAISVFTEEVYRDDDTVVHHIILSVMLSDTSFIVKVLSYAA
jgi:hypothetical protein